MAGDGQGMNGLGAGVAGGVAALWYALPDYVSSRKHRALLKTLLASAGGGLYALTGRTPGSDSADASGQGGEAERRPTGEGSAQLPARWLRLGSGTQVGIVAAVVTLLVGGTIAQERFVHRLGERLARRGVSRPHTRVGLVLGALVALSALPAQAPVTPEPLV